MSKENYLDELGGEIPLAGAENQQAASQEGGNPPRTRRARKPKAKKKTAAFNLEVALIEKLQKYADDNNTSVSAIAGLAISFYLKWMDFTQINKDDK